MSTAVTAVTAVDPINERIGQAKADVATYTKEISNIKTEIGKLGILPADFKTREDYRGYITKVEGLLAKSKADLLKAEREKAAATKIALKAAKKAEVVTKTELKEPVKSDKTPKQILALAELDVEEAQSKVTDLTNEISQLQEAITGLKTSSANTTELKAKQDRLSKVKRELIDAKGVVEQKQKEVETLVTKQVKEEVLPSGSATIATTASTASTAISETTVIPESGSKLSTVTDTTAAEEVRFTFLKQRFIVENKFDGDKLLPKQRAFMEAMNILPVMASVDEKELVKVLENIVNNKNCRSDSWIGLSVKCGPIRTLLNTLADRLWVYLSKDPDILSRQARLETGSPGYVPGSLSPEGKSGIPPGGHPFDSKNDTIITIKVPLRSLYESAFGPITAERERMGATGQNTRGDLSNLKTELIWGLRQKIDELFPIKRSYSSSAPPPLEDPLRQTLLQFLATTSENPNPPESIQELERYFTQTIHETVDSYKRSNPPNRMSKEQEEELFLKIPTIIRSFENATGIVPTIKAPPIGLKVEERNIYDRIAGLLYNNDTITNSLKQKILDKISTIEGNFPSIEGYKIAVGTAIGDILAQLYSRERGPPDFMKPNLVPIVSIVS